MYSSQKNPKTLFQKRKTQKPTLPPPSHQPATTTTTKLTTKNNHKKQPPRGKETQNCQKLPPPIEEIAKKHKKFPETHQEEKPLQTHARGNHFKPTMPTHRSPQATDQQPQATN